MLDKLRTWLSQYTAPNNTRELPKEVYNQNIGKNLAQYDDTANTIQYKGPKEYYQDPTSTGARIRTHEFTHWKQASGGALPRFINNVKYGLNDLVRPYQNIPQEAEALNNMNLYDKNIGALPKEGNYSYQPEIFANNGLPAVNDLSKEKPLNAKQQNYYKMLSKFIDTAQKQDGTQTNYILNQDANAPWGVIPKVER